MLIRFKPKRLFVVAIVLVLLIIGISVAIILFLSQDNHIATSNLDGDLPAGSKIDIDNRSTTQSGYLFVVVKDGRHGYIDIEGVIRVEHQFKNAADVFSEGLAWASPNGGVYGYIDETGEYVIEPSFRICNDFSEGLAVVMDDTNGKYGYIDRTGDFAIEPRYDVASAFHNGVANVGEETLGSKIRGAFADVGITANRWYINTRGERVVEPQQETKSEVLRAFESKGLFGFKDADGTIVIKAIYQYVKSWSIESNVASVMRNRKWGAVDLKGNEIIDVIYDNIGDFNCGVAPMQLYGQWGVIDARGKVVVAPQYNWIHNCRNGLIGVILDGKVGYIDPTGRLVWPPTK